MKDFCPMFPLDLCFVFGLGQAYQKRKKVGEINTCILFWHIVCIYCHHTLSGVSYKDVCVWIVRIKICWPDLQIYFIFKIPLSICFFTRYMNKILQGLRVARRPWPDAGRKKSKKHSKINFFVKKLKLQQQHNFFCIFLLVMQKYWGKQIFKNQRFPEVAEK